MRKLINWLMDSGTPWKAGLAIIGIGVVSGAIILLIAIALLPVMGSSAALITITGGGVVGITIAIGILRWVGSI